MLGCYAIKNLGSDIEDHAKEVVKRLKREGKLRYSGHTKINYDKCYKKGDIMLFKVTNNEENKIVFYRSN